ncbi:MAG: AfsR/SARP family transcriptional regulator [Bacteroidota bacterium]
MPYLSFNFLGGFEVTLDGEPVTAFRTDKVRALLAFLALESHRAHRRSALAAMFWPESSEQNAAHSLSQSLLQLRRAFRLGKESEFPFLVITSRDVQFNEKNDSQLDVARFRHLLNLVSQHVHDDAARCETCLAWRQQAADLYRGDLLAGLSLPDSTAFEEWRIVQQEELHQSALQILGSLAAYYENRDDLERAQEYARRQIALEPWREEAHLQLMRLLVRTG